eukprot:gb/GECH01014317.1/.p1 GENE.gb/GECH01014317.1/~~gb/GECH01014317.1/.p1  ORF type:complete len:793 (+),score=157.53 gb/GECH01014317.1/:1-2379(+)
MKGIYSLLILFFLSLIFLINGAPVKVKYNARSCRFPILQNTEEVALDFKIVDPSLSEENVPTTMVELISRDPSSFNILGVTSKPVEPDTGTVTFNVTVVGKLQGPHVFDAIVRNEPFNNHLEILKETCVVEEMTPGNPITLDIQPGDPVLTDFGRSFKNFYWTAFPMNETRTYVITGKDIFDNPTKAKLSTNFLECLKDCVLIVYNAEFQDLIEVREDEGTVTASLPSGEEQYLIVDFWLQTGNLDLSPIFSLSFAEMPRINFPECHMSYCTVFPSYDECNTRNMIRTLPNSLPEERKQLIAERIDEEIAPVILFHVREGISNRYSQMALLQDPFYLNIGHTLISVSSLQTINYTSEMNIDFRWCNGIEQNLFSDSLSVYRELIWESAPKDTPYKHLCYVEDASEYGVLPSVFYPSENVICCDRIEGCSKQSLESIVALILFIFHLIVSFLGGIYVTVALFLTLFKSDFIDKIFPSRFPVKKGIKPSKRSYLWVFICWVFSPLILIIYSVISFMFSSGATAMIIEGVIAAVTSGIWWIVSLIVFGFVYWNGMSKLPKAIGTFLFSLVAGESTFILVVFALWSTVGLIINPLRVLPFFAAVLAVVIWMINFVSRMLYILNTIEAYVRRAILKRYNFDFDQLSSDEVETILTTGNQNTFSEILTELQDLIPNNAKDLIEKEIDTFRKRGKTALVVGTLSFAFWLILTAVFLCLAVLSFSELSLIQSAVASAMQSISGLIASGIDALMESHHGLESLRDATVASSIHESVKKRQGENTDDSDKAFEMVNTTESEM